MVNWRSPGRAERVVIYVGDGEFCQYLRSEDDEGNVRWREHAGAAGEKGSGDEMTTAELLGVLDSSVQERRSAARGRKFRL